MSQPGQCRSCIFVAVFVGWALTFIIYYRLSAHTMFEHFHTTDMSWFAIRIGTPGNDTNLPQRAIMKSNNKQIVREKSNKQEEKPTIKEKPTEQTVEEGKPANKEKPTKQTVKEGKPTIKEDTLASQQSTKSRNQTDVEDPVKVYQNVSRVIYNRVPKCGSRTILTIISDLAVLNSFHHYSSRIYDIFYLTPTEQKSFIKDTLKKETPMLLDRHIHFINISRVIYINMIREPAERLASSFYYLKSKKKSLSAQKYKKYVSFDDCVAQDPALCLPEDSKSAMIAFFCGQEDYCHNNTERALQTAKRHVEDDYAVVGVVEDMAGFFTVLETILPEFFRFSSHIYKLSGEKVSHSTASKKKKVPTATLR